MTKASKMVSSALLGMDCKSVVVNGRTYVILPPTIRKIAGASVYMSVFDDISDVRDIFSSLKDITSAAKALSWFIAGDESLTDALSDGTLDEVSFALAEAYSLISVENFSRLSGLARNVAALTAKPKQ